MKHDRWFLVPSQGMFVLAPRVPPARTTVPTVGQRALDHVDIQVTEHAAGGLRRAGAVGVCEDRLSSLACGE